MGAVLTLPGAGRAQTPDQFESPQIHPAEVSADGLRLLVVNTPDARLVVYSLRDPARPVLLREIPTAPEPVTVRLRTATEAWVACHLADAIQVVDIESGELLATVEVGDEPSDIAFAGGHAFVSLATRNEVAVLDAATRARVTSIPIGGAEPRWMTRSADGTRVFVAAHKSGNRTTVVPARLAPPQPAPTNPALPAPPRVGLIVDAADPAWRSAHGVDLPDHDVFELDPATLTVRRRFAGVGTTLFGMAERPGAATLWVANTDARNLVRFEPNLRGHVVDNRVTRIEVGDDQTGGGTLAFDLNPGIEYRAFPSVPALSTALAQPTDLVWSPDGQRLYVAAFGTDRIGVLDPDGNVIRRIEIGLTTGAAIAPRQKRGPRGLALHPAGRWLYVVNRLSNTVGVVDTVGMELASELAMTDPTPPALKEARGFLYDAKLSGNGTASCASCHVDGGFDGLAWDLGDPSGQLRTVSTSMNRTVAVHPMKGPMTTQTLRAMEQGGAMHWRGEMGGFTAFAASFDTLLGGRSPSTTDMVAFERFVHAMKLPPNPNQNRDRSYPTSPAGGSAADGERVFHTLIGGVYQRTVSCSSCHTQSNGTSAFAIDPLVTQLPQPFRAAALGTVYRRLGLHPNTQGVRTSGFGLRFDGTHVDVHGHLSEPVFAVLNNAQRAALQAFVVAFDTGTAPAVGLTVALDASNHAVVRTVQVRDLLLRRAAALDCDVIGRGIIDGRPAGLVWDLGTSTFLRDRTGEPPLTVGELDELIASGRARITLAGVAPGAGPTLALDRDRDGRPDGDALTLQSYGSASGPAPVAARLRANSAPTLGNRDFALVAEHVPPGGGGFALVAVNRTVMNVYGIDIWADPGSSVAFQMPVDARGTATLAMPLPAGHSELVGLRLHTQAVFPVPGSGAVATQGLTIELHD
ncbi:MAG: beta-propeller fold lactonase family protein [Planctomycetes bacterium]|nr:beta-propeller fold lactonase family protein [Planctomycetota bacterium]